MSELQITISPDAHGVVNTVVNDLLNLIESRSQSGADVHISLTGGTVGNLIAQQLFANEIARNCRTLHIWWSDERYVPIGHEDRNDLVLSTLLAGSHAKFHPVAGPDSTSSVQESAQQYAHELHLATTTRFCATNTLMDVCILGMGPDGHIASLFPHSSTLQSTDTVTSVSDSPKPPPVRVSWTYPTINAAEQVWLVVAGASKAEAVTQLLAGAPKAEIPATGVQGKLVTRLIVDSDAYDSSAPSREIS